MHPFRVLRDNPQSEHPHRLSPCKTALDPRRDP